jgi:aminoglycoside/choline kinase family phosphotransferase
MADWANPYRYGTVLAAQGQTGFRALGYNYPLEKQEFAMSDLRAEARLQFAREHLRKPLKIGVASADASFRSYWRVSDGAHTWIVMDAPPDKENTAPWLDVGTRLHGAGLHTPQVLAADLAYGFVLMEDLGTRTYLPELNDDTANALYADALAALGRMRAVDTNGLPHFDRAQIVMELELMPEWFLRRHLGFVPSCGQWDIIEAAFTFLIHAALEQPRCFMHRDYHSRNLLITAANNPGIIDFQGAMLGPIAYDLASLLRDCYIVWPDERVAAWLEHYRSRFAADVDRTTLRRWFDLIGLQRHIKVLGIFCRLCYRDGKPGYLADLPRVLGYVLRVARAFPELEDFANLLERAVGTRDLAVLDSQAATPA